MSHTHTAHDYGVEFSGGTRTNVRVDDRHLSVHHRGRLIVDGGDGCVPALWRARAGEPCELVAWSTRGGSREWVLGEEWEQVESALAAPLFPMEPEKPRSIEVRRGHIQLDMAAGEVLWLSPSQEARAV